MAIFNRINKHSKVIGIIICAALGLFILGGDFFGNNSIFNKAKTDVGKINGKNISYDDYNFEINNSERDYQIRTGKSIGENEKSQIQEMAWNELIFKNAYQEEFDKLGIEVTEDELVEMVQGKNIHPVIKQLFANPQTQELDKNFIKQFLSTLDKREPREKELWASVEKSLPADRKRTKYYNLMKKSDYVTTAEAKREYHNQNDKAEIKFLNIPYYSIPDSTVKVTDEDLQEYIDKNKERYKVEEGRSMDYVVFSINPSSKDSALFKKELEDISKEFAASDNDSLFVLNNSDNPTSASYKNIGELPEELKSAGALAVGNVYGPFNQNGKYVLHKISDIKNDTTFAARASHILFKPKSESAEDKAEAKKQANEILAKIKKGENFEMMAAQYGTDGTKDRGGDLGWFGTGQMVKPFNDAVFNSTKAGLLPNLVETEFGYHIIKITEPKTSKKYKVATVEKEIVATEETRELAYKQADNFVATTHDTAEFNSNVKKEKMQKNTAKNLKKNDNSINALANTREIIRWAYNEAEVGDVSRVFSLDNQYVVATLIGQREEGTASLEDVKDEVTVKVRQEKKAEQIMAKLKDGKGDLNKLATDFGPSAAVNTATDITFGGYSIPGLGYEPEVIGTTFGLKKGERSQPIKGENGVVVVELINKTPSPDIADYAIYKNQVSQQRAGREEYTIDEAIKEKADIKDSRYKFF